MSNPAQDAAEQAARKVSPFTDFIRGVPGHMWKGALDPSHFVPGSIKSVMARSPVASFAGKVAGEALGIDYTAGKTIAHMGQSRGFLGAKNWVDFVETARTPGSVGALGKFGTAMLGTGMGVFSAAMTYSFVSEGYQQNGTVGAAVGFGQSVLTGMAFKKIIMPPIAGAAKQGWGAAKWTRAGIVGSKYLKDASGFLGGTARFLGGTAGFVGGGIVGTLFSPLALMMGAGIYGYGQLEEYSRKNDQAIARNKQIGSLELGAPIQDPFGTISTLRQRSLQAIQNTHVNGRMAFGNEAALLHTNF